MNSNAEKQIVALQASTTENLQALAEFAKFWKIPYEPASQSISHLAVMSSGRIPESSNSNIPTVLSPAGPDNARKISERLNLGLETTTSLVHLPYSQLAETSIVTRTYRFKSSKLETVIESDGIPILSRLASSSTYLLSIDLCSELISRLYNGLEDPPSARFRIATWLPFSYRMIPSFVRNRAFRKSEQGEVAKDKLGPVECLRTVFFASLVVASKTPIPFIGFWKRGKKYAAAVTHDIETGPGLLRGSRELLRAEKELEIRSTWNIVTNRYHLTRENLKPLAESGEIGAHDTNHDGRLIFLPTEERIRRLRSCREALEKLVESRVRGFRAPLLQHDKRLLRDVGKAGYAFDSSVPSWELLSPTSLRSHGLGTVFPLEVDGIIEAPVSLPQDHQLIRVRGLTPSEAGDVLIQESKWLREMGGLCTILVHPDYDFATQTHTEEYSRVLRSFDDDPTCDLMTLGEICDWWSQRQKAKLSLSEDGVNVDSPVGEEGRDLCPQIATGFEKNGFTIDGFN